MTGVHVDQKNAVSRRFRMRLGDGAVIFLILLSAVICLLILYAPAENSGALYVRIICGSDEQICPLDTDCTLAMEQNGIRFTVEIQGGTVRISESECENRICVHAGTISREGASIICVPAKTVITVFSEGGVSDDEADFIAG